MCTIAIILWILGGLFLAVAVEEQLCDLSDSRWWRWTKLIAAFMFWPGGVIVLLGLFVLLLLFARMDDIFRGGMSA